MNDFYLAAIPEPVAILGLRLRPFSLGHNLLLHRVESAFISGGPITYEDLALSVFICAQSYAEALSSFNDRDMPLFMRAWSAKLTGDTFWRQLFRRKIRPIDLEAKAAMFTRYMQEGSKIPYYDFPADRVGASEIESIQSVQLTLMSKTTLTESELMDRPWGRCLFDYIALQAMEDKCTIRDKSAIQEAQEIANRLAAAIEKRNGAPQPTS